MEKKAEDFGTNGIRSPARTRGAWHITGGSSPLKPTLTRRNIVVVSVVLEMEAFSAIFFRLLPLFELFANSPNDLDEWDSNVWLDGLLVALRWGITKVLLIVLFNELLFKNIRKLEIQLYNYDSRD